MGALRETRSIACSLLQIGLTRIETRYCTGAPHELLNETNHDEVQRDLLGWLAKKL